MIPVEVQEYAESIVRLHDGNSFEILCDFISHKVHEMTESWFTENRYSEVCDQIAKNVGLIKSLSFIDKLSQGEKVLTLWKAEYTSSDIEVLWSICFDSDFSKVVGLRVEW